jgi:hypothetical protein
MPQILTGSTQLDVHHDFISLITIEKLGTLVMTFFSNSSLEQNLKGKVEVDHVNIGWE